MRLRANILLQPSRGLGLPPGPSARVRGRQPRGGGRGGLVMFSVHTIRRFHPVLMAAVALLLDARGGAQPAPAPAPLVKENATVKVAPHTFVIPDMNVGAVPNVG